jgi:hypothetical protein
MARERKAWAERSPAQRARLERHGINESNYRTASADQMRTARGHKNTPEHGMAEIIDHVKRHQSMPEKYWAYVDDQKRSKADRETLERAYLTNMAREVGDRPKFSQLKLRNQLPKLTDRQLQLASQLNAADITALARVKHTGNPFYYH